MARRRPHLGLRGCSIRDCADQLREHCRIKLKPVSATRVGRGRQRTLPNQDGTPWASPWSAWVLNSRLRRPAPRTPPNQVEASERNSGVPRPSTNTAESRWHIVALASVCVGAQLPQAAARGLGCRPSQPRPRNQSSYPLLEAAVSAQGPARGWNVASREATSRFQKSGTVVVSTYLSYSSSIPVYFRPIWRLSCAVSAPRSRFFLPCS